MAERRCHIPIGTLFVTFSADYFWIFSIIDIVEPFLPIAFQKVLYALGVIKAFYSIVINLKNKVIMKKVLRNMSKGITKMFKRIKALGGMEDEAEMCSSTF